MIKVQRSSGPFAEPEKIGPSQIVAVPRLTESEVIWLPSFAVCNMAKWRSIRIFKEVEE